VVAESFFGVGCSRYLVAGMSAGVRVVEDPVVAVVEHTQLVCDAVEG
jgi:hypothetical protein